MNTHKFLACIIIFTATALINPAAFGQGVMVWSDEFDGGSLNLNNWEPMIGDGTLYGNPGWGNNEWQYYTDRSDNIQVYDGKLHIIAKEESYAGFSYTSARLRTRGKADFLYGRFEASIKLPSTRGIWPAFWMLPTTDVYGGWAASGEIDIMESVNTASRVYGTIHYGDNWPDNVSNGGSYAGGIDYSAGFHVFTVEWEPDEMRWYMDGIHYHTATSSTWYSVAAPNNTQAPFDQAFHMLLNVAVGGNWPGYPDASSTFPQEMVVDWVRVYDTTNDPPTVSIDYPTHGQYLSAGPVNIQASASDPDGTIQRVEFYIDDNLIDQVTSSPYSTTWNAPQGCYRLRVVAVDDQDWTASDEIFVKVDSDCAGDPYLGYPAEIPGTVEFENYDNGGEGIAYHDCDSENSGGQYRPEEGVDLEATEGGYNVGWMCEGEWLNYAVDVQGGTYLIEARVASQDTGGTFALELDGTDIAGEINVPITGGWQTWTTVPVTASLPAGVQELRFINLSDSESYNIDSITFTRYDDYDYNNDGEVGSADWFYFIRCYSGPGVSTPQAICTPENFDRSDSDDDNDVDLVDYAAFQRARTE